MWTLLAIIISLILTPLVIQRRKEKIEAIKEANKKLIEFQSENKTKILYLRSFDADGLKYNQHNGVKYIDVNLETELALKIGQIGHLLCIGTPSYAGDLGIDRYAVSDNKWKDEVCHLMEISSIILFRPSLSSGLIWEFEQIMSGGHLTKTIICYDKSEDHTSEYKLFREINESFIFLPSHPSKYICIDKSQNARKYSTLDQVPIYRYYLEKEKAHLDTLNLKIPVAVSVNNEANNQRIKIFRIIVIIFFLLGVFFFPTLIKRSYIPNNYDQNNSGEDHPNWGVVNIDTFLQHQNDIILGNGIQVSKEPCMRSISYAYGNAINSSKTCDCFLRSFYALIKDDSDLVEKFKVEDGFFEPPKKLYNSFARLSNKCVCENIIDSSYTIDINDSKFSGFKEGIRRGLIEGYPELTQSEIIGLTDCISNKLNGTVTITELLSEKMLTTPRMKKIFINCYEEVINK